MNQQRIFSGIRPTGRLHLGNYLGAVKNWIKLQNKYQCIFAVVDYHGITTPFDPKKIGKDILDIILDYLAAGIDPKKASLIIQSQVPGHTELAWVFGTITPVSHLQRIPTYKEKAELHPQYLNLGLLAYPVLMAADILIYKSNFVPIGEDQLPHLEVAQEIAKRFNRMFGKTFFLPKPILSNGARIMSLTDPTRKMSKSLGPESCIVLSDSPELIWKKLSTAVTDPARIRRTDKGHPQKCNLFSLHQFFSTPTQIKYIEKHCQGGTIGCLECKKILAESISKELAPIRQKRLAFEKKPALVKKILAQGAKKARPIAEQTLKEVKKKIGLI